MPKKLKTALLFIAIPLFVGALAALITKDSMVMFEQLNKPPLSPPGWLFPVVWTILYTLMGIASYLVYSSNKDSAEIENALRVYGLQLVANFLWPIFFFRFELYLFSFFWIVLLWILILYTIILFYRICKTAGYLMIPYLVWVTFAAYLNWGIYTLNK